MSGRGAGSGFREFNFGQGGAQDFSQFYSGAANRGANTSSRAKQKAQNSARNLDITKDLILNVNDLIKAPTKSVSIVDFEPCRYCRGQSNGTFCSHCSWAGLEKITKNLSVKIPKFVKEGQKIRLKNEGKSDEYGNRGDLYLTVKIKDPNYKISGDDLEKDVQILPSQAVLGTKKEITVPEGKITITIPKNTSGGKVLRLKNLGLPKKDGTSGNLNVKVKIILPKEITPQMLELYEKLSKLGS